MQIQIHKCLTHLESTYHHLIDGTRDQDQQHRVGEVSGRNGHETINMIYEKEIIKLMGNIFLLSQPKCDKGWDIYQKIS